MRDSGNGLEWELRSHGKKDQVLPENRKGSVGHVLKDINLRVMRGERIVICGPSGSGKSTMIRCINRLEEHQKGKIIVDGKELTNDLKKIDEVRREVGMSASSRSRRRSASISASCSPAMRSRVPAPSASSATAISRSRKSLKIWCGCSRRR